jgi:uncharacterized protein
VSGGKRPFAVMAKPVGSRCNMRCGYCYYLDKPAPGPAVMTEAVLERFVAQVIAASPGPVVSFTWHGGEPTLAGLPFYRRAVALQRQYLPEGWRCWNNLQTNGLLLDEAWCAFLAREGFDVGLSLDGDRLIHDAQRRDLAGAGTYDRAAAAARRLMDHGLKPDLLCTVTAAAAQRPLEVYQGLRALGTGWMQFLPIVRPEGAGVSADSVSPEAYGEFLCRVFDRWCLFDLGRTGVQLFAEAARTLAGGRAALCTLTETCGQVLVVEKDGEVYACDHFVDPDHRLGSVMTDALADLVADPTLLAFGARKADLPEACAACPHLALCRGGCPKDRLAGGVNYLCPGYRRFFDHAADRLARIGRAGAGAPALMTAFRDEEKAKWRGVGKGDPCPCGSGRKAKACCWPYRP